MSIKITLPEPVPGDAYVGASGQGVASVDGPGQGAQWEVTYRGGVLVSLAYG